MVQGDNDGGSDEVVASVALRGEAWWHGDGTSLRQAVDSLPISQKVKLLIGDITVQAWTEGVITAVEEYGEEVRALDAEFDELWRMNMIAVRAWRAAHPGNDLVMPDMGEMLLWLCQRAGIEPGDASE